MDMLTVRPLLKDILGVSGEDVLKRLGTGHGGLAEGEAKRRFVEFGANTFVDYKPIRPLFIFLSKFKSPLLILLTGAAVISLILGSIADPILILAMVLMSAVIDFVNTYKSQRAAEELRNRVKITAEVWRNGSVSERGLETLVPGDVITLSAGDIVPADCVLLEASDFFVNESILTGESLPVEKFPSMGTDREAYMGTSVVSGRAKAVAVTTGKLTKMGELVGRLKDQEPPSAFDVSLKDFSYFIFVVILFLVLAIILVHLLIARVAFLEMFLFAVAIAVGLTPELLPVIVTANLAKGAVAMSRGGVVVKKLAAIHDFGSIDLICTDKTGTLTEDKIALIKHVDGFGNENERVLLLGYLSTEHRTSVRGTLDKAIHEYKKLNTSEWRKIDEIPFDYERKRESVVVAHRNEHYLISKGAPEEILAASSQYHTDAHDMTEEVREKINATYGSLSEKGFRVLAVATKKYSDTAHAYVRSDEHAMTFEGFLAFYDPPKATAKATLEHMASYGVGVKIITGDNHLVTKKIADDLGIEVKGILMGDEMAALTPQELKLKVEAVNLFTRITPEQKEQIIDALRENGHVVGYLGDGVNDVLSLKAADVGISVSNAVDVAKETADIILLTKGFDALIAGVIEGRKTFANTFKYLMMALSSNFGNMVSMPVASVVLPFLPMTASQILLNNMLYDGSQIAIPLDRIDDEFLKKPKKFNMGFIKKFMLVFGPMSTIFDITTFVILLKVFGFSGAAFQTGWFLESIASQTLVVGSIRSREPFGRTLPSASLAIVSLGVVAIAWLLPYTPIGRLFNLVPLGGTTLLAIVVIVVTYLVAVEFVKRYFYRHWGGLIEK